MASSALKTAAKAASNPEAAVEPVKEQPKTLIELLSDPGQKEQLAAALPPGLTAERFTRVALTAVKTNPDLLELGQTPEGRMSFMHAIHRCAQMGLEPNSDLGHAYLLPFRMGQERKMQLQFILGYKGILELASRSGRLARIDVHEVYENDEYECSYGVGGKLFHRPTLGDRGKIICYYGYAEFQDGGYYYEMLTLEDIEKRKNRSASVKAKRKSPWDTDPIAMSKKTVVRSMAPYLRLSTEVLEAIQLDEQVIEEDGKSKFIDVEVVEPPVQQQPAPEAIEASASEGDTEPGPDRPITLGKAA